MHFAYNARDSEGIPVKGTIEASDRSSAVRMLKDKGLFILSLENSRKASTSPFTLLRGLMNEVLHRDEEDLMLFTRELATMIGSGFPLLTSLEILKEDMKNPFLSHILNDITSQIKAGTPFSECIEQHPGAFSRLYINLVKAAEASGELDRILDSLACHMENTVRMKKKLQAAMLYPMMLISATVVIILIFVLVAIPRFKEIYDNLGAELPCLTRYFLNTSLFLASNAGLLALCLLAALIGLRWCFSTKKGRRWLDRIKMTLPLARDIYQRIEVARFARTLALLYSSGVPLIESLGLVAAVNDNTVFQDAIGEISSSVQQGEAITTPLKKSGLFPQMTLHMMDIGEKSGNLDKMLHKITELYEFQLETLLNTLTSMLEPFLVIFMGLIIGFLIAIMALPIMQLPSMLQ